MKLSAIYLATIVIAALTGFAYARDTMIINPEDITEVAPQDVLPDNIQFEHHTTASVERETTCPSPESLYKDDLIWRGSRGWKSYQPSFINNIAQFTGAYWVGVGIGKMHCIYDGKEELTFRLRMENDNMFVKLPTGEKWRDHGEGNKKCLSNNVNDCQFAFLLPGDTGANIEELRALKAPGEYGRTEAPLPSELH